MGGNIIVESEQGKGSIFTFTVPFQRVGALSVQGNNAPSVVAAVALTRDTRKQKRLLMAEDNALSARIARRLLAVHGYSNITWVENGLLAVEAVEDNEADHFSLILMDCQMPVMDGFEACRTLRKMTDKRKRSLPVIAFTASGTQDDRNACISSGMDYVVLKPFEPMHMVEHIDAYITKRMEALQKMDAET
jgi:CheY-like chemotaxis protein